MKHIFVTLTLVASLSAFNLYAAGYDEFVEIKEGHYAKVSKYGVLTEVATTGDAVLNLNQEASDDYIESLRETVLTAQSTAESVLCGVNTFQYYNVSFTGEKFSVYGETHAHQSIESELLYFRLRTKVKIVAFDVKHTRIEKKYSIARGHEGGWGVVNPHAYAWVDMPLNNDIKSVKWVVRSYIVVDNPDTLDATLLSERDCYATKKIRTSGRIYFGGFVNSIAPELTFNPGSSR